MENEKSRSRGKIGTGWASLSAVVVLLVLVGGCSHSKEYERMEAGMVGAYAAQPPAFLNGPMSALLTNSGGFTAHVTVQGDALAASDGLKAGQLLCRGSKLLFAPAPNQGQKKTARSGGFAFIWDVASASGFVLSGALEGYAPVSSGSKVTNVVAGGTAPAGKAEDRAANAETFVVQMNDGTTATYNVWKSANGFPSRISTVGNAIPLTLVLSDVQATPPPVDVFTAPEEFTKYSSPEALADEVVARQHNLRRKGGIIPLQPVEPARRPGY